MTWAWMGMWLGMVWFGLVWFGMVGYGLKWLKMAQKQTKPYQTMPNYMPNHAQAMGNNFEPF